MARSVTAHGRSGRTVTASSSRTATTVSVSGGGSGKTVHGRPRRTSIAGIGAATLVFFAGGLSASSPPVVDPISGTASATLSMSGAGQGAFTSAYTGTGAGTLVLTGSAGGDVIAPVTGTGAATLALSGDGAGTGNAFTGTGDATLVLAASGAGQHLFPVTGAAASALALTAAAAGRADQLVAGAGASLLALTAAAVGTTPTTAPASIASPVQGSDLTAVWLLQQDGATGPRTSPSNGTWSGSLDAYLIGKGFVIGNDNGALHIDVGSSTVTIDNYRFLDSPRIQWNGTNGGKLIFNDCDIDTADVGGMSGPRDINGTPTGSLMAVEQHYCRYNRTTQYWDSGSVWITHPRISNQVQQLWGCNNVNVLIEDFHITGGGCFPPPNSHVEAIQYNAAAGYTFVRRRGVINLIDGQASLGVPAGGNYGWTGVDTGPGGGGITWEDVVCIGIAAVDANPLNPNRIACSIQYNNGTPVTITNCVLEEAAFGYTLNGSNGAARPTVSGNRTFGNVALGPADFH